MSQPIIDLGASYAEQRAKEAAGRQLKDGVLFRKGAVLGGGIHQEPTLLTFFFAFHWEQSPLFSSVVDKPLERHGVSDNFSTTAKYYFKTTMGGSNNEAIKTAGTNLALRHSTFVNILKKINSDMPWFWDSVSGLETARLVNLEDQLQAADKPKIDIQCLDENIELTATRLMSMYRSIVWDDKRKVRILPVNLTYFDMTIYVAEVRNFQTSAASALLGSYRGSNQYTAKGSNQKTKSGTQFIDFDKGFKQDVWDNSGAVNVNVKPHYKITLKDCEFDLNSIPEIYSELTRNPESKKPKITINFKYAEVDEVWGGPGLPNDIPIDDKNGIRTPSARNPMNPIEDGGHSVKDMLKGLASNAADEAMDRIGAIGAAIRNTVGIKSTKSVLGNVNPPTLNSLAGPAGGALMDRLVDNVKGLFLGNVYGVTDEQDVKNMLEIGALNSILNQADDWTTAKIKEKWSKSKLASKIGKVYEDKETDNSAQLQAEINANILNTLSDTGENVYDGMTSTTSDSSGGLSPKNINEGTNSGTLDSSPDGSINANVYD